MSQDTQQAPWQKLYELILHCGNIDSLPSFIEESLASLKKLCDFDAALVYFFDGNQNISHQYLLNIDRQWSTMYQEYYAYVANGRYNFSEKMPNESKNSSFNVIEWDKEPASEFVTEYIRPRRLKHSVGFILYDMQGRPRSLVTLDRTRHDNFAQEELRNLDLVIPLLNILNKKYYPSSQTKRNQMQGVWEDAELTSRENEVVNLLCQGITPKNISKILHISQSTTSKHISNIHQKMNVYSIQELLVKLLG